MEAAMQAMSELVTKTDDERRIEARMRCLLPGKLVFNWRGSTLDCVIRNKTSEGYRLTFSNAVALPRDFEILVESTGVIRPARLMWSTGEVAGIKFL
jgi:hypothetical protein